MNDRLFQTSISSPLGDIVLCSDGTGLCGLWFRGQKYFPAFLDTAEVNDSLPVFEQTRQWLSAYFAGEQPAMTVPLSLHGSPFRLAVWELLRSIPYGQVTTYGELARRLAQQTGKRVSAQAVGGAVGHNPMSILVPCHRVVGADGSLTGYAGGLDRKAALLTLEGIPVGAQTQRIR